MKQECTSRHRRPSTKIAEHSLGVLVAQILYVVLIKKTSLSPSSLSFDAKAQVGDVVGLPRLLSP